MSATTFDMGRFVELTDSIEELLGYLKGNELVDQWADEQLADPANLAESEQEDGQLLPYTFDSYPADGQYAFPFATKRGCHVASGRTAEWDAATKATYDNGASWAAGTASYVRSLAADLTGADAAAMQSAIEEMKRAGDDIGSLLEAGWISVELDDDDWFGGATRQRFNETILRFNDYLRDQYLAYWRLAEGTFGATAAVVVRLQNDLIPYLESVESGLKEQLLAWVAARGNPGNVRKLDTKAADALKLGYDVAKLIPVVGDLAGKVEKGADIGARFIGLFSEPPPRLATDFVQVDPDAIYIAVTADFAASYGHGLHDALDLLRSERSSNAVADQRAIERWLMRDFTDLPDQDWRHALERR